MIIRKMTNKFLRFFHRFFIYGETISEWSLIPTVVLYSSKSYSYENNKLVDGKIALVYVEFRFLKFALLLQIRVI